MATAKLLHEQDGRPNRTIRIVTWMGEERGLLNARSYGKEHATAIANHFAAIETDSGAGHAMGIYTTGDRALTTLFQPIAALLDETGTGILRELKDPTPDLIPLYFQKVPAFTTIQDTRKY